MITNVNLLEDFPLGFKWLSWVAATGASVAVIQKAKEHLNEFIVWTGEHLGIAIVWTYTRFLRWHSYHWQEVNTKQKCPACGIIAHHKIHFDSELKIDDSSSAGAMVHTCVRCECQYGQPTIVPVKAWFRVLRQDEDK